MAKKKKTIKPKKKEEKMITKTEQKELLKSAEVKTEEVVKQEPPKVEEATPLEIVTKHFEPKEFYKLKICPLWTSEEGTNYFRVNYLSTFSEKIISYWVEVKSGILTCKTT